MPNRNIKEIESFNNSNSNPIDAIRDRLTQLGYKIEPEMFTEQNLNSFSRHLITFSNTTTAFDVNIERNEHNKYEVHANELNKNQKDILLKTMESFKELYTNLSSKHVNEFVDSMIKNNNKSSSIEGLNQYFIETVSNRHIEELEAIKLSAQYKFAIKSQLLKDFEFTKRFESELNKQNQNIGIKNKVAP